MEDLARNAGWYLSVAVFAILALGMVGWAFVTVVNVFRRKSASHKHGPIKDRRPGTSGRGKNVESQ